MEYPIDRDDVEILTTKETPKTKKSAIWEIQRLTRLRNEKGERISLEFEDLYIRLGDVMALEYNFAIICPRIEKEEPGGPVKYEDISFEDLLKIYERATLSAREQMTEKPKSKVEESHTATTVVAEPEPETNPAPVVQSPKEEAPKAKKEPETPTIEEVVRDPLSHNELKEIESGKAHRDSLVKKLRAQVAVHLNNCDTKHTPMLCSFRAEDGGREKIVQMVINRVTNSKDGTTIQSALLDIEKEFNHNLID